MIRPMLAALALGMALAAGTTTAAGAHVSDGCGAEAVFSDGTVVDPAAGDQFTVPRSGSVDWVGRIGDGTAETPPRMHSGRAEIVMPPLGSVVLGLFRDDAEPDVRTWRDEDATTTMDQGRTKYDIPSWVPAGAGIRVEAVHIDSEQNCDGWVVLTIDGNPLTSPTTLIAIAGTIASAAGLVLALRAQPGITDPVRGRPAVGLITGGLLGIFVTPLLWAFGVIDFDSSAWLALPIFGAIGGLIGGLYPPFRRPTVPVDVEPEDPGPPPSHRPSDEPPATRMGPAGTTRTLSEMESEAGGDPPPSPS